MTAEPQAGPPQFGAAEIGAMAHLYRGEMDRSKIRRTRLDATTIGAVVTAGIAMSSAFSAADATPLPIARPAAVLAAKDCAPPQPAP